MTDTKFYVQSLRSEECLCGRKKKSGMTFCYICYKSLSRDMQKKLYQRMGDGYEDAVDAACIHLQQEVWA